MAVDRTLLEAARPYLHGRHVRLFLPLDGRNGSRNREDRVLERAGLVDF